MSRAFWLQHGAQFCNNWTGNVRHSPAPHLKWSWWLNVELSFTYFDQFLPLLHRCGRSDCHQFWQIHLRISVGDTVWLSTQYKYVKHAFQVQIYLRWNFFKGPFTWWTAEKALAQSNCDRYTYDDIIATNSCSIQRDSGYGQYLYMCPVSMSLLLNVVFPNSTSFRSRDPGGQFGHVLVIQGNGISQYHRNSRFGCPIVSVGLIGLIILHLCRRVVSFNQCSYKFCRTCFPLVYFQQLFLFMKAIQLTKSK